ncbi:unnamed protein product [Durusdinium trenchii]|uniref:Fungal lipase-type domain-containing protein n=1 Tax=Durusdinium trenchii TaxID=1381693 RepID=A0ABP0HHB6_9DINO
MGQSFVTAIDLPSGISRPQGLKFASICGVNGKAVAAPRNAEKILVVDPATGQASSIDLPSGINPEQGWKFESICAVNGRAVAAPRNAEKVLVVDPATGQASSIDLPSGINPEQGWKLESICAVNGRAVAAPRNAEKVLVAELPRSSTLDVQLEASCVHHAPEFPEFVAAVLSKWIYSDDLEPPCTIPNTSLAVHQVIQPGDLGAALKMATVTATLPTERVLFVIFKGTSYILDFLNWNLELDHSITGDKDFFAHSGAAGTLRKAHFWKSSAFAERLRSARANGVRKVVFTGHSLGGMYAQMSLYLAWKSLKGPPSDEREVLESFDLRCCVFGSPMVFGGSSQQAKEFRTFVGQCACNYIHADDPCARAWSAINLQQFVRQASLAARKGLTNELGSVKGSVVSRVVEGMVSRVMNRPDFYVIEDFARKYEHFVPLKVLSRKLQFARWKEFNLNSECFKDHYMENYVDKLFDALDDSRPECYIHSIMP